MPNLVDRNLWLWTNFDARNVFCEKASATCKGTEAIVTRRAETVTVGRGARLGRSGTPENDEENLLRRRRSRPHARLIHQVVPAKAPSLSLDRETGI